MNRKQRITAVVMAAGLIAVGASTALAQEPSTPPVRKHAIPPGPRPYDTTADPQRDLTAALAAARRTGKRVLVVFGANWCPDCRVLDREFHAGGKTAELIAARYEVVKVDVGDFDHNLDFAKLYGEPIKKGIPSVVIVTPKNEVVYQTKAGELADARSMGADGIYAFFREQADRPAGS
jgi:protein disulfide-isomerase